MRRRVISYLPIVNINVVIFALDAEFLQRILHPS